RQASSAVGQAAEESAECERGQPRAGDEDGFVVVSEQIDDRSDDRSGCQRDQRLPEGEQRRRRGTDGTGERFGRAEEEERGGDTGCWPSGAAAVTMTSNHDDGSEPRVRRMGPAAAGCQSPAVTFHSPKAQ